jgi:glycosyltransferase involved in cell wall biosynthesis|nr:glycosyltransferase [uncultured Acetatifactor sp.]
MKSVIVIMSTYNGSSNVCRQLDSIFRQKGVEISVVIRDDNSKDDTVEVLKKYAKATGKKIKVITGINEGYAKSFWDALRMSGEADYYAFSDQDDVWKDDKLIKSITPIEESAFVGPKLAYCRMQRSDKKLNRLDEQVRVLRPTQLSKKICLTQTYNYGAATIFNGEARELICRCWPDRGDVPHDLWAGLLCYWFGEVFYVDEELYYWIRYESSVTGEGTKKSGKLYRLKESLRKKSYPNVAKYILDYYSELVLDADRSFLNDILNYKDESRSKSRLLFDKEFRRSNLSGTFILKMGILLNWY